MRMYMRLTLKPKIVNSKDKLILKSDSESARNFHLGTLQLTPLVLIVTSSYNTYSVSYDLET
jgi:hypothetical protein